MLRDLTNKPPNMDVHGSREGETTVERHVGRKGENRRGAVLECGGESVVVGRMNDEGDVKERRKRKEDQRQVRETDR